MLVKQSALPVWLPPTHMEPKADTEAAGRPADYPRSPAFSRTRLIKVAALSEVARQRLCSILHHVHESGFVGLTAAEFRARVIDSPAYTELLVYEQRDGRPIGYVA